MKIAEYIQKDVDGKIKKLQDEIDALNKDLTDTKKYLKLLPKEITDIDDCNYVWTYPYDSNGYHQVHINFKTEESIKQLKIMGIQGFRKKFWGEFFNDPNDWRWEDGKLIVDNVEFTFNGGKTRKPVQCRIEEYEEPAKPAAKRLRAICNETGKEV
jgi:hypothetical protein